jgi:hypothetical protein
MQSSLSDRATWLSVDLALLEDASGFAPTVARDDLQVGKRPMPDDPNHLFRWRLPVVNAPAEVVFEGFVRRVLDYHREWTREFTGGHVVSTPEADTRIIYQRFEPGIPGISPRDLCSAEVVQDRREGVKLVSFRSIDTLPKTPGFERIDWWGAALCRPIDAHRSELIYLDRENQGGRFPAWAMNLMMTRYLVLQAESVRRFFANGGPPELRQRQVA